MQISGKGFHITNNGERKSIEDSLVCLPGEEFTAYARNHLSPFPWDVMKGGQRDILNLWPGRCLKVHFGDDKWRKGWVLGWVEWLSGPFSNITHWTIKIGLEKCDATHTSNLGIGDLVSINKSQVGVIKDIKSSGEHIVFRREYRSGDFVETMMECKLEDLCSLEELERKVDKANVNDGGVMAGGLNFVWVDPPLPEPTLSEYPETCYHNSSEDNFNGEYQDAIKEFLNSTSERKSNFGPKCAKIVKSPDYNPPYIEEFVQTHGHLVNDDFCNHCYAYCMHIYLTESSTHLDILATTPSIRRLMILAANLRYRYIPNDMSSTSAQKIAKCGRDIHTERGISRLLSKEISCPCAAALSKEARKMKRTGVCFKCNVELDKTELKDCSKCMFARYCTKHCQVEDWPLHMSTCKAVRKEML